MTEGPSEQHLHMLSLLRTLWPEPAAISVGRGSALGGLGGQNQLVVLPSLDRPKLLVPQRPRRVTARAIASYQASMTGRKKVAVGLLSSAARLGLADLLPHRVTVSRGGDDIERYLERQLGQPVRSALYIGPPRAVQKPVLQLLTDAGETIAFAKVGINSLTNALVRGEAAAIRTVLGASRAVLQPPALLHHGQWSDHEVIVIAAIQPQGTRDLLTRLLPAATAEVAEAAGVTVASLLGGAYWRSLSAKVHALPPSSHAGQLARIMGSLDRAVPLGRELPFGSWHGDWAPWNMMAADNRVYAWDWEHFETGVPVGYDALHYDIQQRVVYERTGPVDAFARVSAGAEPGLVSGTLDSSARDLLLALYVVQLAVRYLEQGEVELGGTAMGRLGEWLPQVTSMLVDRVQRHG